MYSSKLWILTILPVAFETVVTLSLIEIICTPGYSKISLAFLATLTTPSAGAIKSNCDGVGVELLNAGLLINKLVKPVPMKTVSG